jgi:hypothetical protein
MEVIYRCSYGLRTCCNETRSVTCLVLIRAAALDDIPEIVRLPRRVLTEAIHR